MNSPTNPISASTSVNAMPRIMVVCSRAAISGWRAWPSTVFPTMMPMPIPGPMADRPYPIMLTLPLMAASAPSTIPTTSTILYSFPLVLLDGGQSDVGRSQQREHIRLHGGDEDLQGDAHDPADEGDGGESRGDRTVHEVVGSDERDHQQQVPREEVREQPDHQGERPEDLCGGELDRRNDDVERLGNA